MRTNNIQKIKVLENILQQIVDNSNTIYYYDIETLSTENEELLVNAVLSNEDGIVIREFEGTYFEVLCDVKLVLYGLLD